LTAFQGFGALFPYEVASLQYSPKNKINCALNHSLSTASYIGLHKINSMKVNKLIVTFITLGVLLTTFANLAEAQVRRRARVVRHVVRPGPRVRHRVVVRRAHVRYAHLPRWGTAIAVLPAAAVVVRAHSYTYHFHNGIYYAPRNNNFVVVRPVAGVRVRALPNGFKTVMVSRRNYYYYYGTFYSKTIDTDQYEVVDAPVGAIVDALPEGYEIKNVKGTEYYVLDGVYYAEVEVKEFEDGVGYEVVEV
jgi:hypothetical protein